MTKKLLITTFLVLATSWLSAQTISEKKAGVSQQGGDLTREAERFLIQVNHDIDQKQEELKGLYSQARMLYDNDSPDCAFADLLEQIAIVKSDITRLQNEWRDLAIQSGGTENYALWHQPDTTLEQLVIDYGSNDYVYIMSPDIASMRISVDSNLPIPRSSWNEVLELILTHNGVGIEQLNPFLRQLYLLKDRKSAIQLITNDRCDLVAFPLNARVSFVLSPDPTDVRRITYFLENFVDPNRTVVQQIGRDILIVGEVGEIYDLLKLYDFITTNRGDKEYKAISLRRVVPEEMARILGAIFDRAEVQQKNAPLPGKSTVKIAPNDVETNGLKIIVLDQVGNGLFLVGTREEIHKAEMAIMEVESQVGEAREKTIYWYNARFSDPEELADVLEKIYNLMITTGTGIEGQAIVEAQLQANQRLNNRQDIDVHVNRQFPTPEEVLRSGYYEEGNFPINPAPIGPAYPDMERRRSDRRNFIVDFKTGSIVMVVEADILPKLKEVLRRLDVPKKMVHLEVLLFEKQFRKEVDYGLNLLQVGCNASNTKCNGLSFTSDLLNGLGPPGLLSLMFSRKKTCGSPAYDIVYNFLLSQDDVTINSAPSVLTVNQTPAFISIQEEISLNTGTFETETLGGVLLKDAFTRAQYGITIKITPTIHSNTDLAPDEPDSVTLVSDILFDTQRPSVNPNRPDIIRRKVQNEARVMDGQSVILGGLRRKETQDSKDAIPFLGELPGLGKLFSYTKYRDNSTEMFIIITPKIVYDPAEDLEKVKRDLLALRPGDIPEYLCQLNKARECEHNQLLEGWITILFGREPERCYISNWRGWEYDGR